MESATYKALAAPFTTHHKRPDGLTYLSGEQIITRLNEVLGAGGWSFKVLEHGVHAEADEVWVLGELQADIDGTPVVRQQFGSQKFKRPRNQNADGMRPPLDVGFDLKGGTTDALKKCASLIGIGLYLSSKEELPPDVVVADAPKPRATGPGPRAHTPPPAPTPIAPPQQGVQNAPAAGCPRHGTDRWGPSRLHQGYLVCSVKSQEGMYCNFEAPNPATVVAAPAPVVDEAEFDAVFDWGRPS